MSDLISRQAAFDVMDSETVSTNPEHFKSSEKFIKFMDDADITSFGQWQWANGFNTALVATKVQLEKLPSPQQWIPIKMRPMDAEEREYWEDHFGYELADEDAVLFDCQMPDDGQEILVSYRKWICMDKCEIDGGCYGLEGNGDWEDVIAWMPLPEPYKEGKNA